MPSPRTRIASSSRPRSHKPAPAPTISATASREIAEETVKPKELQESIVGNLQKVQIDEEDAPEELASLSDAAEALRLTAAAPPRPTPSGGDYE